MQRLWFRYSKVAASLFVMVIVLLIGSPVAADENANMANTLKVTPVRVDVEIKPGTSKVVQATVTNLTKTPMTVRPVANDFISGDERGTPALILDAASYAPTHSLKRFMALLPDVTIPAGQSKVIDVTITVPKDAQAGGYFGAIRLTPTASDTSGQVNLSASVASLILMTVPGDTVEKLDFTHFDIQQNGKTGVSFATADNLQVSARFQNGGNIQLSPFGKVSVKKDDKVIYAADFNTQNPHDLILPDSARRWDIPLSKIDGFGHYTVLATFTYGKTNQTIEVTKSFWVIPTVMVVLAAAGLAVLLFAGVWIGIYSYRRRHRHRYGRHRSRR